MYLPFLRLDIHFKAQNENEHFLFEVNFFYYSHIHKEMKNLLQTNWTEIFIEEFIIVIEYL